MDKSFGYTVFLRISRLLSGFTT